MKNWIIRCVFLLAMAIPFAGSLFAQSDPKDKASADQAMKAINKLIGGDAISAKDSAAIIANYKTASGGPGVHYESQTTTTSSKTGIRKDTMRIYFANSGEGRVEMTMPIPGAAANPMIILGRAKSSGSSIILYPASRTFALQRIDTSLLNGNSNFQITKVGNETVQGYPCIHAKMVSVYGSGSFKVTTTTDLWTSISVPGYSNYSRLLHLQPTQIGMMAALDKAGCMGYIVKMQTTSANYNMVSVLVKAEEGRYSADLFRIPSGYTESDENMFSHMMPGAGRK
jgi:hypothetical protein